MTPPKSLPARIIGVLTAPRATYGDVAARPRWLGVVVFVVLVGAGATFVFLSTEVGKRAVLDQQVRTVESFGVKLNDAAYQQMEQRIEIARYTGPIFQAILLPLMGLLVAGLVFAVFNAILGGSAAFRQVFAVVAHSGVVTTIAVLFGLPLAYARETMSGSTSLADLVAGESRHRSGRAVPSEDRTDRHGVDRRLCHDRAHHRRREDGALGSIA
jgi:hypothetical protein